MEEKPDFTDEELRFWLEVRNTHARINGKKEQDYTKKQMLTWYNKLYTDSAEYKMWGNGIALPPALYVLQGMRHALDMAPGDVVESREQTSLATIEEPTDLSDAPEEIKTEIITNDEILREREHTKKTTEEETMETINREPATIENVIPFNAIDQLRRLASERKALANLKPDDTRFADDVRAIEYAVGFMEAMGL